LCKSHKNNNWVWYVDTICDCWNLKKINLWNIRSGSVVSCWCYNKEIKTKHWHAKWSRSKAYKSWADMVQRCKNSNNTSYRNYWWRWITVCDEWLVFDKFLEDMWEVSKWLFLDRVDNEKWYYKGNCRWATRAEQNRNKRDNVWVMYEWEMYVITDLAKKLWMSRATVRNKFVSS